MTALSMIMAVLAFALFGLATRDHHRKRFDIPLDPVRARQMRGGAGRRWCSPFRRRSWRRDGCSAPSCGWPV